MVSAHREYRLAAPRVDGVTAMHIVTASDDNYVSGVMVLICSAVWHNPQARFTVLDMGIAPENCRRLARLADRLGVVIDRVELSENPVASLPIRRPHLTRCTYLRLMIPDLMPQEDRVIYMDCDMAVTGDLTLPATIDLGEAPIAAVACPTPDRRELRSTGTKAGHYVNAGFLVMNLPVWRRENLAQRCIDLLSDPRHPLLSEDQSAVNIACAGRILHLPYRYNVYANAVTYRRPEDLPGAANVLHYVVSMKPWRWQVLFGEIWHFHADRIADLMPPDPPRKLSHYVTRLEMYRRAFFGLAMGRSKHWQRLKVKRAIRDRIVQPYLAAQQSGR